MKHFKSTAIAPSLLALTLALGLWPVAGTKAQSSPLRVLVANAVKSTVDDLHVQAAEAIGRPLAIHYDTSVALKKDIDAGEGFDVVIGNDDLMAGLLQEGKIDPSTRAAIARTGIGIAVAAGAPKPDVSTPEAVKATLLKAKAIAYPKEGASTPHILDLFHRLGIEDQIKNKVFAESSTVLAIPRVTSGQADILLSLMSEILPDHSLQLAGPLPAEYQSYLTYSAAFATGSANNASGKALLKFLASPAAVPAYKAEGMEQVKP